MKVHAAVCFSGTFHFVIAEIHDPEALAHTKDILARYKDMYEGAEYVRLEPHQVRNLTRDGEPYEIQFPELSVVRFNVARDIIEGV